MSGFFSQGAVDTRNIDRDRLPEGTYRIRLTDAADHIGAYTGNRTQFNFMVVEGPSFVGSTKSEIVGHQWDQPWKADRARGDMAAIVGAFAGMSRDKAGVKITKAEFLANTRTVNYANGGKDVASVTRDSSELPLVQSGGEAILVVKPYFNKKTGKRNISPKTGKPSVVYEFLPVSCGLAPTTAVAGSVTSEGEDDADMPPAAPEVDALDLALADGWRRNGESAFYYKRGEAAQLKADALRAKYGA